MAVSAQFSLYPLRGARITPVLESALAEARRTGVAIQVGRMSSVMDGTSEQVFQALRAVFDVAASSGDAVLVATVSNACPVG